MMKFIRHDRQYSNEMQYSFTIVTQATGMFYSEPPCNQFISITLLAISRPLFCIYLHQIWYWGWKLGPTARFTIKIHMGQKSKLAAAAILKSVNNELNNYWYFVCQPEPAMEQRHLASTFWHWSLSLTISVIHVITNPSPFTVIAYVFKEYGIQGVEFSKL